MSNMILYKYNLIMSYKLNTIQYKQYKTYKEIYDYSRKKQITTYR